MLPWSIKVFIFCKEENVTDHTLLNTSLNLNNINIVPLFQLVLHFNGLCFSYVHFFIHSVSSSHVCRLSSTASGSDALFGPPLESAFKSHSFAGREQLQNAFAASECKSPAAHRSRPHYRDRWESTGWAILLERLFKNGKLKALN